MKPSFRIRALLVAFSIVTSMIAQAQSSPPVAATRPQLLFNGFAKVDPDNPWPPQFVGTVVAADDKGAYTIEDIKVYCNGNRAQIVPLSEIDGIPVYGQPTTRHGEVCADPVLTYLLRGTYIAGGGVWKARVVDPLTGTVHHFPYESARRLNEGEVASAVRKTEAGWRTLAERQKPVDPQRLVCLVDSANPAQAPYELAIVFDEKPGIVTVKQSFMKEPVRLKRVRFSDMAIVGLLQQDGRSTSEIALNRMDGTIRVIDHPVVEGGRCQRVAARAF